MSPETKTIVLEAAQDRLRRLELGFSVGLRLGIDEQRLRQEEQDIDDTRKAIAEVEAL